MQQQQQSLKDKQRAAVYRMLNFNANSQADALSSAMVASGGWSDQWKVLVYDRSCRDIISTLVNVTQLRKQGVTLHMLLEADREPITDVPAVYFCQPTVENLRRIAQDCGKQLYSRLFLNFASKLERPLMESLAREAVALGAVNMVAKVCDQYLDFVSLEPRLFTLNRERSYVAYNDPSLPDADVEASMAAVAAGLLSVFATLQAVPVIRCPGGGPAQMVAEQLNKLLSDHLLGGSGLFAGGSQGGSYQRPLLLLLDRSVDLVTALRHASTYQALLDDVLDHRLNRVAIDVDGKPGGGGGGKKRRTYDVDAEADTFYSAYKGAPFPEAIEANGSELAGVTQREESIRRKTAAAGINVDSAMASGSALGAAGAAAAGGSGATTQELAAAVESLPALLEQKKNLEMHTNILKAIMDAVAAREVPVYFEAEEDIMAAGRADKARLLPLLRDGKGSLRDKLRLLAVCCLAARPPTADMAELEAALREAAAAAGPAAAAEAERGLAALGYLRRQVSLQHLPTMQAAGGGGGQDGEAPTSGPKYIQGFLAMAQTQATGLLARAAATAGQLLPRANRTYVTSVVHALLERGEEDESYLMFDPKLRGGGNPAAAAAAATAAGADGAAAAAAATAAAAAAAAARARAPPPREVMVFLIGGGNYAEFQNLQDYVARRGAAAPPLGITYGCTQLVNAEAFLEQLYDLGGRPPG